MLGCRDSAWYPGYRSWAASSGCHGHQAMLAVLVGKLRHGEGRSQRETGAHQPKDNPVPSAASVTPRSSSQPIPKFSTRISRRLQVTRRGKMGRGPRSSLEAG